MSAFDKDDPKTWDIQRYTPPPKLQRVYIRKEVAAHLRVSERTVTTLIKIGVLESFVPYSRNRRITEDQLARFIEKASTEKQPETPENPPVVRVRRSPKKPTTKA